jgi:hypothetical protein
MPLGLVVQTGAGLTVGAGDETDVEPVEEFDFGAAC